MNKNNNRYNNSNTNYYYYSNNKGIINYGGNCYLNSGLQIIASCDELIKELENYNSENYILINLLKDAIKKVTNWELFDPKNFIDYYSTINNEIAYLNNCSQNFIRTLIRNINQEILFIGAGNIINIRDLKYNPDIGKNNNEYLAYQKFIKGKDIFPQSKAMSIFSGISKFHSYGTCLKCYHQIDEYSFNFFIDLTLYLDSFSNKRRCNFSEVLDSNIGKSNNITMECPKCHNDIYLTEITKIVKIPDILIFTFERFIGAHNNVWIEPEKTIDFKKYVDNSLNAQKMEYELFAINIRFGENEKFGHEICQVKRNGNWYEINDTNATQIHSFHHDYSYGLFYKKI